MRKSHAKEIEGRAANLLRKHGLYAAPVNIATLAENLGANVIYEDLEDDVSGFLLRERGESTIAVNSKHHSNRQRFTLAHECGHLFLHADKGDRLWVDKALFFRDASSSSGEHKAEVEANQFAAALLMPKDLINEAVGNADEISEFDVVRLAFQFGVSEKAMTVRLISLGLMASVTA